MPPHTPHSIRRLFRLLRHRADVVRLFEQLGVFREPIAGRARARRDRKRARRPCVQLRRPLTITFNGYRPASSVHASTSGAVGAARRCLSRELGPSIPARVPAGLDARSNGSSERGVAISRVEPVRGERACRSNSATKRRSIVSGVPGGFRLSVHSIVYGRERDHRLLRIVRARRWAGALREDPKGSPRG